jgi:uncharacterized protein DUF1566
MRTLFVRLIALTVFTLLAPASAWAQAQWGEPINTPGDRFIVLESYANQAVYDKETGLVWEQAPSTFGTWQNAQIDCNSKTVGNRKGWRLPTIQELASLIDPTVLFPGPTLPAGHPFNVQSNVQVPGYWSATTNATNASLAWFVHFASGSVFSNGVKSFSFFIWCVRGGQGVDPQ